MTVRAAISLSKRQCHEVVEAAYGLLESFLPTSEDFRVLCPWETIALAVLSSVTTTDPTIASRLPLPQPSTDLSFTLLAQKFMQQSENCLLAEDFVSAWTYACAAQRITANGPSSLASEAYYHLGRVLDIGFGLSTKAEEMYEAGLAAASAGSLLHTSLACLHAEKGELDRAHSLLSPPTASPHCLLAAGYLHSLQGDWQQALHSYQQAGKLGQALSPYYQAVIIFNQATACDNLDDLSTARCLYQSLLKRREIGTIPLLCYRNMALIEYRQGDTTAARRILKVGVRLGTKRWSGAKALAELLGTLAELLDSRKALKKAQLLSRAGHIYRCNYSYLEARVANAIAFASAAALLSESTLLSKARSRLCLALSTSQQDDFGEGLVALAECDEALKAFDQAEAHLVLAVRAAASLRRLYR